MSVMNSQPDGLMDRLVVERAIDSIVCRQIEAVLRKYDASVQVATVDNLIARPMSFRVTPSECEATARRIIAGRSASAQKCQACDGTGWKYLAGADITDRGEVIPCHQCQRERATGWRNEQAAYRATWRTVTVDVLDDGERRAADDERDRVLTAMRARHEGGRR